MNQHNASKVRVGVVIVHFGNPAPTKACLAALERDSSRAVRRVVVVDNGGTLKSGAWQGANVLSLGGNPGFGAGVNAGVAALGNDGFDVLIVLNNDIEVADGYIDAGIKAVGHPGVGLAAGPLYLDRPGGALWYAGGGVNWLTGTVRQRTSAAAAGKQRTVGFVPGAAFAIGVEAWRRVGGFDPSYFLYNEDVDLCLRLRRNGWRLFFSPEMVSVHRVGAVTGSREHSPFYLEQMAATRMRPFRPLAYRLYLAMLHSGYTVLRVLWYRGAVRGGASRVAAAAIVRGHRRALRQLMIPPRVD